MERKESQLHMLHQGQLVQGNVLMDWLLGTPPSPIPTGQRLRFTLWLAVEVMMQSSREETYGSLLPANCPGRTG